MTDAVLTELRHIGDGGRWCLDGRKERRLQRLGLIETPDGKMGWVLTEAGRAAIKEEPDNG